MYTWLSNIYILVMSIYYSSVRKLILIFRLIVSVVFMSAKENIIMQLTLQNRTTIQYLCTGIATIFGEAAKY